MKNNSNDLKIKRDDIISEFIQIFERESLVVKNIIRIKKLFSMIIVILTINTLIWAIFKNLVPIFDITIIAVTFIYFFHIFKYFFEGVYKYTKDIGGKKIPLYNLKLMHQNVDYNLKLMRESEEELLKSILKQNRLYNLECMSEIKDYLMANKKEDSEKIGNIIKNVLGAYLIPIIFGVIGIYTSFVNSANIEQEIIKILYIAFIIIAIFVVLIIVSITHILKEESITESYTNKRLIKLLTNNIISMNRKSYYKRKNI